MGAYLSNAKGKDAAALVNAMDTDKVAGALSTMKGKSAAKMLSSLDAQGADAVMHKMDVVQVSEECSNALERDADNGGGGGASELASLRGEWSAGRVRECGLCGRRRSAPCETWCC